MRHLDAAEVVELVGLTEAPVAWLGGRSLDDREGLIADRLVDARAPRRELLGRKVGREEREAFLAEESDDGGDR